MKNIAEQQKTSKTYLEVEEPFDHYIAVDWSLRTMAIARMTQKSQHPKVIEQPSNVQDLKA